MRRTYETPSALTARNTFDADELGSRNCVHGREESALWCLKEQVGESRHHFVFCTCREANHIDFSHNKGDGWEESRSRRQTQTCNAANSCLSTSANFSDVLVESSQPGIGSPHSGSHGWYDRFLLSQIPIFHTLGRDTVNARWRKIASNSGDGVNPRDSVKPSMQPNVDCKLTPSHL
jgi:hypothetical protein